MEMLIGPILLAVLGVAAHLAQNHAHRGRLLAVSHLPSAESTPIILTGIEASRNADDLCRVLRQKEMDIERVRKEIEVLRFVIPMLADDAGGIHKPSLGSALPSRRTGTHDA